MYSYLVVHLRAWNFKTLSFFALFVYSLSFSASDGKIIKKVLEIIGIFYIFAPKSHDCGGSWMIII